ncbi:hypothetical protein Ancab_004148, partial [Ancistrocladus abbreviatus]
AFRSLMLLPPYTDTTRKHLFSSCCLGLGGTLWPRSWLLPENWQIKLRLDEKGALSLFEVQFIVLHEADQMLNAGLHGTRGSCIREASTNMTLY